MKRKVIMRQVKMTKTIQSQRKRPEAAAAYVLYSDCKSGLKASPN